MCICHASLCARFPHTPRNNDRLPGEGAGAAAATAHDSPSPQRRRFCSLSFTSHFAYASTTGAVTPSTLPSAVNSTRSTIRRSWLPGRPMSLPV